jgi:hypothetical protein
VRTESKPGDGECTVIQSMKQKLSVVTWKTFSTSVMLETPLELFHHTSLDVFGSTVATRRGSAVCSCKSSLQRRR